MHRFEDHVYIVAFSGTLAEIDMYLGPTWFITVRRHDPDGREWDPQPIARPARAPRRLTPRRASCSPPCSTSSIDGYFDTTDELEDKLEVIEDSIFSEEHARRAELAARPVRHAPRAAGAAPCRRAVARGAVGDPASGGRSGSTATRSCTCRDAFDKLLRAVDLVDEQRELVGNAVDAHLAVM